MKQWLGDSLPAGDSRKDDDEAFALARQQGLESVVATFRQIRQQQIDMLDALSTTDWSAPRETLWGNKPLSMIVTKTFQHTFEHGDTLMRMGLWWQTLEDEKNAAKS